MKRHLFKHYDPVNQAFTALYVKEYEDSFTVQTLMTPIFAPADRQQQRWKAPYYRRGKPLYIGKALVRKLSSLFEGRKAV